MKNMPTIIRSLRTLAQALYDIAYRWSALIEIYKNEDQPKKIEQAKTRAITYAQKPLPNFLKPTGASADNGFFITSSKGYLHTATLIRFC